MHSILRNHITLKIKNLEYMKLRRASSLRAFLGIYHLLKKLEVPSFWYPSPTFYSGLKSLYLHGHAELHIVYLCPDYQEL